MDDCSLRSVVCKVVLSCLDDTADAADVDYAARVAVLVLGGLLEKRQECSGHEVALRYVGLMKRQYGDLLRGA